MNSRLPGCRLDVRHVSVSAVAARHGSLLTSVSFFATPRSRRAAIAGLLPGLILHSSAHAGHRTFIAASFSVLCAAARLRIFTSTAALGLHILAAAAGVRDCILAGTTSH